MTRPEAVATDSGPLISLARVGMLDLLEKLPYRFISTPAVSLELRNGEALGFAAVALQGRVRVSPEPRADLFDDPYLGPGELSVIRLALSMRISLVCIDDKRARQAALSLGLKPFGTLGLLRKAKDLGLIPRMRPIIEDMQRNRRWFGAQFVEEVLGAAGE